MMNVVGPPRDHYVPGDCNIGAAERQRRWIGGWVGLAATAVLWAAFVRLGTPRPWRLTLFIPAFISATGFVQAWHNFCVGFGMLAAYNFSTVGERTPVTNVESNELDRAKARRLIALSVILATTVAALGVLL